MRSFENGYKNLRKYHGFNFTVDGVQFRVRVKVYTCASEAGARLL